jgi:antitoxin CptB
MNDTAEDALDRHRRRLRYQSWHRGTREVDLMLGRFADRHLAGLDAGQLDRFAALLTRPDPDIYDWIAGRAPVPPEHDTDVMALLRRFNRTAP